jgi:ATP-dependent Clp protease protease subunit
MWPFTRRGEHQPPADVLLQLRGILLHGPITDKVAQDVIARLLFLQYEDAQRPLSLRIECPGGALSAGMAIVDAMRSLAPPVRTEAPAFAQGMAAIILAAGCKGERVVGPHARVALTTVWSPDRATSPAELEHSRNALVAEIAELTGQPVDGVVKDLLNGRPFTPSEAVAYGLVDRVGIPLVGI